MGILGTLPLLYPPSNPNLNPKPTSFLLHKSKPSSPIILVAAHHRMMMMMSRGTKLILEQSPKPMSSLFMGAGIISFISLVGPSNANAMDLIEPSNALSLPTWAIHVSSVLEWVTAMALVWQYGEITTGLQSWKALSWGMVPLLGGALCACTWHFFYNSQSLEALVVLQAALTVIGNATMCLAAYRIYMSSQKRSNNS